jgi:hypothetical protein
MKNTNFVGVALATQSERSQILACARRAVAADGG